MVIQVKRNLLLVNSTSKVNSVTEQRIGSHDYYVISGAGSMVGNTVMNGIYYPLEEVKKLASSNVGRIPAPVSHPKSESGDFVSASDQVAQNDYGIGSFSFNYRMDGDRLVRDIAVPKVAGINADKHASVISRINEKSDIDSSTGVIFCPIEESGVGADGEEYSLIATNMSLDHDALLPFEVGASTTLMGTGLFANASGDTSKVYEYNASIPAMNLPLAPLDTEWDSSEADKLIRDYTNSGDEPSSTYRRYFMYFDRENVKNYTAYKLPFATVINGRPHAVLNAINNASARLDQTQGLSDSDKASAKRIIEAYQSKAEKMRKEQNNSSKGMFAKAWNSIKSAFAKNELSHDMIYSQIGSMLNAGSADDYRLRKWPCDIYSNYFIYRGYSDDNEVFFKQSYHITSDDKVEFDGEPVKVERVVEYKTATNGENAMRNKILAALNAAGVKTEGLNDDALLSAYNEMMDKKESVEDEEKPKEKAANLAEMPEWFKPYASQLSALNASEETKLNDAAKKIASMNCGITEDAAKAMGLDACNSFLAKNQGFVNTAFGGAGFSQSNNSQEDQFDMTKLGGDE